MAKMNAIHLRQHEWHSCVTAKVLMGSIGLGGAQWGGWCAAVRLCAQASSEGIKGIKCVQRVACCAKTHAAKRNHNSLTQKNESLLWFLLTFSEKARKNHVAVSIFSRKHVMQPVSRQPLHLYY